MEIDNLNKWLDLAKQYQAENFWKQIFEEKEQPYLQKTAQNPFSSFHEHFPKCDLYEDESYIIVEIEIPGVEKENVDISLEEQFLKITGEFKSLYPNRKYFLKERVNRKFKKELTLPFPVQFNNSSSEIINGVLIIKFPKAQDEMEEIPIHFSK